MNTSPFQMKCHLSDSCCCFIRFFNFAVSALTSIPRQSLPLPSLSFTRNFNPLHYNFTITISVSQVTIFRRFQKYLARAAVKSPKSCHTSHILRYFKITEHILLQFTYKAVTSYNYQTFIYTYYITVQPPCRTPHTLFIYGYYGWSTYFILVTLLSTCFTLSLESGTSTQFYSRQSHAQSLYLSLSVVSALSSSTFQSSLYHSQLYFFTNPSHHKLSSSVRT